MLIIAASQLSIRKP